MAIETSKFKRKKALKDSSRKIPKMGLIKVLIVLFVLIPLIFLFTDPKDRASFFSYQTAKIYERFGKYPEAKKYYFSAYENSGKEDIRAWIKMADICNKLEQYFEARTIAENIINFGITDEIKLSEVNRHLGDAHFGLTNYEDALVAYLQSVKLNEGNYYGLIGTGKAYRVLGDYVKSREYLENAIEKRQLRAPEAHYELGLTYRAENNNADALEEFELVLRQMPSRKLKQKAQEEKINIISNK